MRQAAKGVPASMGLTDAGAGEWRHLAASLRPGRTYVMDRGYACFALLDLVWSAGSSFACRVRDDSVHRVLEDRPVTLEAAAAGIVSDRVVMLGGDTSPHRPAEPVRLVGLAGKPHAKRASGTGRGGPGQSDVVLVATDLLDPPAEVVGLLLLRCRWRVRLRSGWSRSSSASSSTCSAAATCWPTTPTGSGSKPTRPSSAAG